MDELQDLRSESGEEGIGYLIVNVRTAGGALPVQGAIVTVYDLLENGDLHIFAVLRTGSDGATRRLALATPPLSGSTSFGGEAFTLLNVDTSTTGYYNVRSIGIQVFPGVLSVQNVDLVPVADGVVPAEEAALPGGGTSFGGDVRSTQGGNTLSEPVSEEK